MNDSHHHEQAAGTAPPAPGPLQPTVVVSVSSDEPGEKPGDRIGHYKLLEQIGEGGMGSVWVAEQRAPVYPEKVALKFIKLGMDTKQVIARFEAERQALALTRAALRTCGRAKSKFLLSVAINHAFIGAR